MRDGNDRESCCREQGKIAEGRTAANEILDAVAHEVRARAFHELNRRQLVFQRDLLRAQPLVETHRLQRSGLDAGITRSHHTADAGDEADACDSAATGNALLRVRRVEAVTGQRGEFEERRTGIEQQCNAFARKQLPTLMKALF